MELNYQPTLLQTREEIAVVILGPLMNIVVFSLLVVFAWICPKVFGLIPDIASKFVMAYGIMTFFDPLLTLLMDCALMVGAGGWLVGCGLAYGLGWIGSSFVDCTVRLVWFELGLVWVWVGMI
ncbi:MAG: hypothetical protein LGB05_07510 [Sulfurovum sp.]|nr:hypothetical protein [Sulfurovum sp.]